METLQKIVSDLCMPSGLGQYSLDDSNQTFATPDGQIVTLADDKLNRLTAHEPDAGARQVYRYFKFIRDRAVLPSPATTEVKPLGEQERTEIITECIARAFDTVQGATTFEILSQRIYREYPFFHRTECSKYPADIQQLTREALRDFVRYRIDAWKYEIVRRFNGEVPTLMENFESSLVEIILSIRLEAKAQELSVQKMLNPNKLHPIAGLLYRGGSLYELDKARRIKTGQPCFDIHMVNKAEAIHGRGLYTTSQLCHAAKYPKEGSRAVILEITANNDSGLMQFDDPLNKSLRQSLLPSNPFAASGQTKTVTYQFSASGPVNIPQMVGVGFAQLNPLQFGQQLTSQLNQQIISQLNQQLTPQLNQQLTPQLNQQPTPQLNQEPTPQLNQQLTPQFNQQLTPQFNQQLTPQFNQQLTPQFNQQLTPQFNQQLTPQLSQQHTPAGSAKFETKIVPIINNVPHPLVGAIKCSRDITLIVNPRFVQKIKVFDRELLTKIDLDFSAQEIVTNFLVPKFTPALSPSQQGQTVVAQLIDPLTCQSSYRPIFHVEIKLPFKLSSLRNRDTEVKYYTPASDHQWLRVKPKSKEDANYFTNNKSFVITYTRSQGGAMAGHGSVAAPIASGVRADSTPPGVSASNGLDSNCDVCLTSTSDGPTVRLSATQIRHQECHAHAITASSSPGDSIHGTMSWKVDHSPGLAHIAREDSGSSGVIVVHFHFVGPQSYRGRQLSPAVRQKEFMHFMPNSLIGCQILKALQNAFMQGKVVTIDESNTNRLYGICFNLHLRTGCNYGDPHGYPCPNWSQSLIDGLLSAGVDIDLDDQNPQLASAVLQK